MDHYLVRNELQDLRLFSTIPPNKIPELILPLKKVLPGIFSFDSPERLFPLSISRDSENQEYICCDANRYMGSTRSPWTNIFYPSVPDAPFPKEQHRHLEELLNNALSHYAKSYYVHDITTSVYCLGRDAGVIICFLIKSALTEIAYLIDINEKLVSYAIYNLSVAYSIRLTEQEFSNQDLGNFCFCFFFRHNRSEEIKLSVNIIESHVRNVGRLIETHQQRIDSHSRHFEYLSQWALSNIHEVRHIRLLLADIFNKNVAQSSKSENEEEEGNLIRNEIDTSFKEIRRSLKILEESAARWKKIMDPRALLPYNLVMSLEQMDIQSDNENTLRRIDWLVGRNEACRWLKRTNYRTEAIQLSLANCGRFLRNTTFVPLSSAMDLTHLSSMQMTFAVIDVHTRNPILYIKVGEVMHCLLTFGNLCMENIIVRSLDESHCLPSYKPRFNRLAVSPNYSLRRSQAMSELLHSQETNGISPNLLQNLDNVSESQLPPASQLDLRTPSRYVTFVQITEAARNALVHFANVAEPQTQMTALHQFCEWLATYTRLYQDVCVNCNRLLGCDAALPVLRTFTINPTRACAQHEHCRGSNVAL